MTSPWKLLVVGLAVYSAVLTWAFVRMVSYLQWLHFSDTVVRADSLSDTTPGMQVSVTLGVVGGLVVVATLRAFAKHQEPTKPHP
ncbi:MAG: hypothetical protein H6722_29705 [Sandaracinus sp.]|nr:hypothetical protein [Sandaracinus sp.]